MAKRRYIKVTLTVSVAPGITKAVALKEIRTRVNEECCYHGWIETSDVRVRKAS